MRQRVLGVAKRRDTTDRRQVLDTLLTRAVSQRIRGRNRRRWRTTFLSSAARISTRCDHIVSGEERYASPSRTSATTVIVAEWSTEWWTGRLRNTDAGIGLVNIDDDIGAVADGHWSLLKWAVHGPSTKTSQLLCSVERQPRRLVDDHGDQGFADAIRSYQGFERGTMTTRRLLHLGCVLKRSGTIVESTPRMSGGVRV